MTPHRLALAAMALLGAGLLAGCDDVPPPPSTTRAAVPAGPAGPVSRFDGTYAGRSTLEPDRTRACRQAPRSEVVMQVRDGRGSVVIDPELRQTLTGSVSADGTARLIDRIDRTVVTTGQIANGAFSGYHQNGPCRYSLRLDKRN
jgi:hypothetical protein